MEAINKSFTAYERKDGDIIKSNYLIEAKYDLNLIEQKLVLMAISKINPAAVRNNIVSLKVRDFCELIGTSKERYTEFREILRQLRKEILLTKYDYKQEIKEELIAGWINTVYYKNGIVEIAFPEQLMPYLVELKEKYTVYNIENVVDLSSKHSIRMYELMKEHEYKKSVSFDYIKIKELICLGDKFNRYYDFKKRVLEPAKNEISKKCDICFDYTEQRRGKKIELCNSITI